MEHSEWDSDNSWPQNRRELVLKIPVVERLALATIVLRVEALLLYLIKDPDDPAVVW